VLYIIFINSIIIIIIIIIIWHMRVLHMVLDSNINNNIACKNGGKCT